MMTERFEAEIDRHPENNMNLITHASKATTMQERGTVTRWVDAARSPDKSVREEAARQIWQRFSGQLLRLADQHLSQRIKRRVDADDVLQGAFVSVCARLERGEFPDINSRDNLWSVLITLTLNKTRLAARRATAAKRDVRREVHGEEAAADDVQRDALVQQMDERAPDPAEAALMVDQAQYLLNLLDSKLRQIALWKMNPTGERDTPELNEEIAEKMSCSVRSVERKLAKIRRIWKSQGDALSE